VSDLPDIIYVVRSGDSNPSLRFSLRSLANMPHRQVIVAGYCPSWVRNVAKVPVRRQVDKFTSIENNLIAALTLSGLSERVVYFNDDFYVMEPIDEVPVMNGGPSSTYHPVDKMRLRFRNTLKVLGMDDPLRYDGTHVPLPLDTYHARYHLSRLPDNVLWRTWYGNVAEIGGVTVQDVKSHDGRIIPGPFMSSSHRAINSLRQYLDDVLPKGGPYV
jgi:hypothetical protein